MPAGDKQFQIRITMHDCSRKVRLRLQQRQKLLVDLLWTVPMHPMGGIQEACRALVGHELPRRLGELPAEIPVAVSPEHLHRNHNLATLRLPLRRLRGACQGPQRHLHGTNACTPHAAPEASAPGAVVVDGSSHGTRVGSKSPHMLLDDLGRHRRIGVRAQHPAQEGEVGQLEESLREQGSLKCEDVPRLRQLLPRQQAFCESCRMRHVENREPLEELWILGGRGPSHKSSPIMANQHGQASSGRHLLDQPGDVLHEGALAVARHTFRLRGAAEAPEVRRHGTVARGGQRRQLRTPAAVVVRESVQQHHCALLLSLVQRAALRIVYPNALSPSSEVPASDRKLLPRNSGTGAGSGSRRSHVRSSARRDDSIQGNSRGSEGERRLCRPTARSSSDGGQLAPDSVTKPQRAKACVGCRCEPRDRTHDR
mmetsp:Transcript_83865/g.270240  ORF Transcript_83865/g.270240 Transcript_83865/m.270240 type:complete len:426 (-) Transcript_83865:64-1341(-)